MKWPDTRTETDSGTEFTVEKVYQDADGNTWYGFTDPLVMPANRALVAEIKATWADMNMRKEDLKDYVNRMIELGKQGEIVKMFHILQTIANRLEWVGEEDTMLELAATYFVINDEPLIDVQQSYNELKLLRFKQDKACRAFFLRRAFVLTTGFSEFSEADILNYLTVQRMTEAKAAAAKLREGRSSDTSKPRKPFKRASTK